MHINEHPRDVDTKDTNKDTKVAMLERGLRTQD